MDLLWSTQAIGLMAFFAAGCMVTAGLIATRRWARREALRSRSSRTKPAPKPRGPRVMVVGVLGTDKRCARLEDAAPVAATTFQASRGKLAQQGQGTSWCDRVPDMWVEVGKVRITIEGPARIEVGSEEHYPASPLTTLPASVGERVRGARAVQSITGLDVPRHGAFRSMRAGDPVVLVGIIEPAPKRDGWLLRPDSSGAVTLYYRRRPIVRGGLGGVHAYAAA